MPAKKQKPKVKETYNERLGTEVVHLSKFGKISEFKLGLTPAKGKTKKK